jgi:hypothetical protein
VAAIAMLGVFSYIFILGDVRRIELEGEGSEGEASGTMNR